MIRDVFDHFVVKKDTWRFGTGEVNRWPFDNQIRKHLLSCHGNPFPDKKKKKKKNSPENAEYWTLKREKILLNLQSAQICIEFWIKGLPTESNIAFY